MLKKGDPGFSYFKQMKIRTIKKRIAKRLKQFKWQLNYINGHHLRYTLLSKGILYRYVWRKYSNAEVQLCGIYGHSNQAIEKKRLKKLWNA